MQVLSLSQAVSLIGMLTEYLEEHERHLRSLSLTVDNYEIKKRKITYIETLDYAEKIIRNRVEEIKATRELIKELTCPPGIEATEKIKSSLSEIGLELSMEEGGKVCKIIHLK